MCKTISQLMQYPLYTIHRLASSGTTRLPCSIRSAIPSQTPSTVPPLWVLDPYLGPTPTVAPLPPILRDHPNIKEKYFVSKKAVLLLIKSITSLDHHSSYFASWHWYISNPCAITKFRVCVSTFNWIFLHTNQLGSVTQYTTHLLQHIKLNYLSCPLTLLR